MKRVFNLLQHNSNTHLTSFHKKGFILIQTLVLLAIFSSFILMIEMNQLAQKQAVLYLQEAQELSNLHFSIILKIRNGQFSNYSTENYSVSFQSLDEVQNELSIEVSGQTSFTLLVSVNIDNMSIKSYNYTGL